MAYATNADWPKKLSMAEYTDRFVRNRRRPTRFPARCKLPSTWPISTSRNECALCSKRSQFASGVFRIHHLSRLLVTAPLTRTEDSVRWSTLRQLYGSDQVEEILDDIIERKERLNRLIDPQRRNLDAAAAVWTAPR